MMLIRVVINIGDKIIYSSNSGDSINSNSSSNGEKQR